jgi:hypothetical protein
MTKRRRFNLPDNVRRQLAGEEILRRAAKILDAAKAADDPALLLSEGKVLFSALLSIMNDTDATEALVVSGRLRTVSDDEFRRAITQTTSSKRDGIAHAARLLFGEAYDFWETQRRGGPSFEGAIGDPIAGDTLMKEDE